MLDIIQVFVLLDRRPTNWRSSLLAKKIAFLNAFFGNLLSMLPGLGSPLRWTVLLGAVFAGFLGPTQAATAQEFQTTPAEHPRLYFRADDLPGLRMARQEPVRAKIWSNMTRWADWCAAQPVRRDWLATLADDPQYENLYDRFYAAMHDTAVLEHLALTWALSDATDDRYLEAARAWTLSVASVWGHEAENTPDASKAYAVLRVMKALAVAYDVLYDRLTESERELVRTSLLNVGQAYYVFFQEATTAGEGYNKHHGSVDASPFGIMALALLGEAIEAEAWLKSAIDKHVDYLLPHGLTASGTNDQSSNFWASTLQYRILFIDPLRRVTGRDLFAEFPDALPGAIALAAVAGGQPRDLEFNENHRSVLFGPSYGQINYWSPVMLYLARHHRRPIYQHLALWDESLGSLQRTRYVTPRLKEELLFCFGPYAYLWYDESVTPKVDPDAKLSYEFSEPEVNEVYLRDSFVQGGMVVGMKKGGLVVHGGGRVVFADKFNTADANKPASPIADKQLADDGTTASIDCSGPPEQGIGSQRVVLTRPGRLSIKRQASQPLTWWFHGTPIRQGNSWTWPDGTELQIVRGDVSAIDPKGEADVKKHYGGMEYADPHPFYYPTVTITPHDGEIEISITASKQ